MKEEILKLRSEGKSYKEIKEILGCSKSTISYYCGEGQQEKSINRTRKRRKDTAFLGKLIHFQNRVQGNGHKKEIASNDKKLLRHKCDDFQRERLGRCKLGKRDIKFKCKDVVSKFGENTICYISGRPIDLLQPKSYSFDHKIPVSKGGKNTIENLGITCREANTAKGDLAVDELLKLCKDILEHNGYKVEKLGSETNGK